MKIFQLNRRINTKQRKSNLSTLFDKYITFLFFHIFKAMQCN